MNLDRDAGSPAALDGYIVTPAVRRALSQIADGLGEEGGDRAWSLVGPYGSGKSAFAVFLADLLSPSASRRREDGSEAPGRVERHCPSAPEAASGGPHRRACGPGHAFAEVSGLDARSDLEATEGRAKPSVLKNIRRLLNGADPVLSPVRDIRRRRLLRGSAPGGSSEDRRRSAADGRRGRQGAGVRRAAVDAGRRLPVAGPCGSRRAHQRRPPS